MMMEFILTGDYGAVKNFYNTEDEILDCDGNTPLCVAASLPNTKILKFLLKKRKDIRSNKYGNNPLHIACESGLENNIRILSKENFPFVQNNEGCTPLAVAMGTAYKKFTIPILLKYYQKYMERVFIRDMSEEKQTIPWSQY